MTAPAIDIDDATRPGPDPAAIGEVILETLARGRRIKAAAQREQAAKVEADVRREIDRDKLRHGDRGRAGRIARRLRMKERTVRKVLYRLSGRADSLRHTRRSR